MSSIPAIPDHGLRIPTPPRGAARIAPRATRRRHGRRWTAVQEAMLAFSLGLVVSWALGEVALWLGGA